MVAVSDMRYSGQRHELRWNTKTIVDERRYETVEFRRRELAKMVEQIGWVFFKSAGIGRGYTLSRNARGNHLGYFPRQDIH